MKIQKKAGKNKIVKASESENIMSLAHAGTKEAVAKLEKIIAVEKDKDKKAMTELALEECQQIYYEPKNEKEDQDFFLLGLINRRVGDFLRDCEKISALECRFYFAEQELRVRQALLAKAPKKKTADSMEDIDVAVAQNFLSMARGDLEEARKAIIDQQKFIDTARQLIVTERYKKMPFGFMDGVHFDDEGSEDLFEDLDGDDEDFCPSCCGVEDCCSCLDDGPEEVKF